MASVFKRFMNPQAEYYVFQDASELKVDDEPAFPENAGDSPDILEELMAGLEQESAPKKPPDFEAGRPLEEKIAPEPEREPDPDVLEYAEIQARAILQDAEREVEEYRNKAMNALDDELDELRREAREDGYQRGLAEGLAEGHAQARIEMNAALRQHIEGVRAFLEDAVRVRDNMLDQSREELKDLALSVAEKVIRVSLKSSGDIILRMIESATDKLKRCEWAQIYLADCDVKSSAYTIPELTAALQPIADRVRVIPMADDDSGNLIIEMPDLIIDASVSTQLGNMKEILDNAALDRE